MGKKKTTDSESFKASELRRKAERQMRARVPEPVTAVSEADARALVHELQVHQIELEMQNEELRRAQAAAAEASEKYLSLFDFAPVGYFLWDHHGRIQEVNLAGAALIGRERGNGYRSCSDSFWQRRTEHDSPNTAAWYSRTISNKPANSSF
jgi:PAS domain-containing protein